MGRGQPVAKLQYNDYGSVHEREQNVENMPRNKACESRNPSCYQ